MINVFIYHKNQEHMKFLHKTVDDYFRSVKHSYRIFGTSNCNEAAAYMQRIVKTGDIFFFDFSDFEMMYKFAAFLRHHNSIASWVRIGNIDSLLKTLYLRPSAFIKNPEDNQMYEQNRKLASEKENPEIPDNSEDNLKIIKDLISMRDTLQARPEWASEALDENDNAVKIINNQIKETGKLLQNAGVKILDDCGSFDSRICTVIQTTPTNDPSLVDTIAQIFRPGYEYRGEMIRSKEVILYAQE